MTPAPIRYVLNTHHHGDHTGSNGLFTEVAEIVMHRNARANMVRGNQAGPGHLTFNHEGAVHIGDLVSEGQRSDGSALTPVFDYANGGSALEFPNTLDGALSLDFDLAIPGHGFLMDKPEVRGYRDRVAQLGDRMAAYIAAGGVKAEIEAKFDTSGLGWPVVGNFARALGNMYDEVAAAGR